MPTTVLEALACNTHIILYTGEEVRDTIKNALASRDARDLIFTTANELETAKAMKVVEKTTTRKHITQNQMLTRSNIVMKILNIYRQSIKACRKYRQYYKIDGLYN